MPTQQKHYRVTVEWNDVAGKEITDVMFFSAERTCQLLRHLAGAQEYWPPRLKQIVIDRIHLHAIGSAAEAVTQRDELHEKLDVRFPMLEDFRQFVDGRTIPTLKEVEEGTQAAVEERARGPLRSRHPHVEGTQKKEEI